MMKIFQMLMNWLIFSTGTSNTLGSENSPLPLFVSMTERLGDGLQNHLGRFDSGSTLQKKTLKKT